MSDVPLTEKYFSEIGGWEAMKQARAYLAMEKVLSSNWTPPILKGVVQAGEVSYRAGLVIKGGSDVDNMCSCRQSRDWGTICAHSIAVGLHYLQKTDPKLAAAQAAAGPPVEKKSSGRKLQRGETGIPSEISVILPPNLGPALARGKVMVCFEGLWQGKRAPLNSLPMFERFKFSAQDQELLTEIERIAEGDTPGMMQIDSAAFAAVLSRLVEHPRVTFGRSQEVTVSKVPFTLSLQATLEVSGEIILKESGMR